MPTAPFTDAEFSDLVRQVDDALARASTLQPDVYRGPSDLRTLDRKAEYLATPDQIATLEQATKEPMETFWTKFLRHARRDLCLPGGTLHEKWKKWRDLPSKDAVTLTITFFAGAGLGGMLLAPAIVAAAVVFLNTVAKIGIDALCQGCAEEEAARQRALQADEPELS